MRYDGERLPVQVRGVGLSDWSRRLGTGEAASVPAVVGEAAWQGYDADGHGRSQSCQRIHERGGFGLSELGYYIARAVDEGRVRIEVMPRGGTATPACKCSSPSPGPDGCETCGGGTATPEPDDG